MDMIIFILGFNGNELMLNPMAGENSTWMRRKQECINIKCKQVI